jgi:hypothetical protein
MVELLVVMLLPTLVFGIFAVLSLWLGAETRPWFDERPVRDDRPNWYPIARRLPSDEDLEPTEPKSEPRDGALVPVAAPAARSQPRPAGPTRAATSPSGV